MRHLGDITKLSGRDMPPVDVITGGSPCQDLSVAGKGAGLAGERSGLFLEQIRIVKEMRAADGKHGRAGHLGRPRFMVWENVPGALSSNGGQDFRRVLEEIVRIAEPEAPDVPLPPKGKWPMADCWYGDGWSIAYRILDAQFWGVPQRRRRVALVADFGGRAAPEILFVQKSVCGNIAAGGEPRQTAAARVGNSIEAAGFRPNAGSKSGSIGYALDCAPTLQAEQLSAVATYSIQGFGSYCKSHVGSALLASVDIASSDLVADSKIRRLTPLECERLQGFPDGWTDIGAWIDTRGKRHKESSDSARYRALGNSIALPPWKWVLKRIAACYERDATMGSLFDGIGGFPLIWERLNGKGSCIWSSEIEEFCIAVTKRRFEDDI